MSQSPRRRRAMTEQAADAAVDQAPGPHAGAKFPRHSGADLP
jgi:hypothetical protein